MYIELISLTLLFTALITTIVNVYLMSMIRKQLKSSLLEERLNLIRKEISILDKGQRLHQTQTQFDASRLEGVEKILTALISQAGGGYGGGGGGFDPGDGTVH